MPPRGTRYTLVGFSAELDWRPLVFVKPLRKFTVCSGCGLVRKRTALLRCMHVLCSTCYEQSTQDGACICPRDRRRCEGQDVDWKDLPLEDLLKKEVKCWNEDNGCGHVMMAADICKHLQRECQHHSTCCPVCSEMVLCKDIYAHLTSSCAKAVTTPASTLEGQSRSMDEALILPSYKGTLQKVAEELEKQFEHLCSDVDVQYDRLNELSYTVKAFTESVGEQLSRRLVVLGETIETASNNIGKNDENATECTVPEIDVLKELTKELEQALKKKQDTLTKGVRELAVATEKTTGSLLSKLDLMIELTRNTRKSFVDTISRWGNISTDNSWKLPQASLSNEATTLDTKENTEKTLNSLHKRESVPALHKSCHEFFIRNVSTLSERARRDGFDCYDSERVYIAGYCVTPGVCAMKAADSVAIHIGIQLHKGNRDDLLQWPFERKIRMRVVHPNGHDELALEVRESRNISFMQRPSESNDPCYYPALSLDLHKMIIHGYVEDDQLRVMWELLP